MKQYAIINSRLQNLRFILQKSTEKVLKNELAMYVANTAILEYLIFSERYQFRL